MFLKPHQHVQDKGLKHYRKNESCNNTYLGAKSLLYNRKYWFDILPCNFFVFDYMRCFILIFKAIEASNNAMIITIKEYSIVNHSNN